MNAVQACTRTLRRHAVGFVALFVALGGSSYAAVSAAGQGATRQSAPNLTSSVHTASSLASIRVCAGRRGGALRMVAAHARCRHGERALTLGVVGPSGARGATGPAGPAGPAVGPAGGALTGNYPNPGIATGAVGTSQLAPGAVGSSQLAGAAVGPAAFGMLPAAGTDIYPYYCVAGNCNKDAPPGIEFTACFSGFTVPTVPEATFDTTGRMRLPGATACTATGLPTPGVGLSTD